MQYKPEVYFDTLLRSSGGWGSDILLNEDFKRATQQVLYFVGNFNSVLTRRIVKTSGMTRGVCKHRCLSVNVKVFLWNSWRTGNPEKIKSPQKTARKVAFAEPRLLQCT